MKLLDAQKKLEKVKKVKISLTSIGIALGLSKQRISQLKNTDLQQDQINKLESYFEVDLKQIKQLYKMSSQDDCYLITVRGNISASMGYGVTIYNEKNTGVYHIGKKLAHDIDIKPDQAEMIFAQGDSMLPTIESGDSLLIDMSKKDVYDGKIYCVRIDGQLYAKRLQKIPPCKIKVVSDNKDKYDSFYVDFLKNPDFDFEIIGEVLWWGRIAR